MNETKRKEDFSLQSTKFGNITVKSFSKVLSVYLRSSIWRLDSYNKEREEVLQKTI